MNKNKKQTENRKEFIKQSLNNPNEASKILIEKAERLAEAKRAHETVKILSEILYLSHKTIYLDCAKI